MRSIRLAACLSAVGLAALPALAQFQFGADWKISGAAFESYQARTYQSHARDYAHVMYYQAQGEQNYNAQTARQHAANIRKNIEAADKSLEKVRQAHPDRAQAARLIDSIRQQHTKAIARTNELDAHLAKPVVDPVVVGDHAHDVAQHLEAAASETDKLRKELNVHDLPAPAKSTSKGSGNARAKSEGSQPAQEVKKK